MNFTTSSVGSERFEMLPRRFIEESGRTTHSALFSKVPIWRNYALDKACLCPCSSGDESYIRARISMPLMRMRESKG